MTKTYHKYAIDATKGNITVCRYVRLACQRYLNDLERSDIYFDEREAVSKINLIQQFNQYKGKYAGQPIKLQPHQQFVIANQFGWKRKSDGFRRFRISYEEVARKNGKTTVEAAKQLAHLIADNEEGPNVYAAANKEDQAKLVVNDAGKIVNKTPVLKKHLKTFESQNITRRIVYHKKSGFIAAVASDSSTLDGLDPSWASIDEYHEFKNNTVRDVLETGQGARQQPFLDIITTAGFNRHSVCYEFRSMIIKILEGIVEDDETFGIIFTLDDEDDWQDENVWCKANPNLGVTVSLENLRGKFNKAKNEGSSTEISFKTKNLNIWTDSAETWIQHETWANLERNYSDEDLIGVPCWGGLDLSSTNDLTAFVLCFDLDGTYHLKFWFFTPKDRPHKKDDVGVDYDKWVRDGYLLANEGNVIDYDFVKSIIEKQCEKFEVNSIGFDPYNAPQIVPKMADEGIALNKFAQGITTMSHPTKDFERRVMQGTISHEENPCMDWQMSNVEIYRDANENIKVTKKNAHKSRVDGVVASIMALGEMITNSEGDEDSVYNERGIITI